MRPTSALKRNLLQVFTNFYRTTQQPFKRSFVSSANYDQVFRKYNAEIENDNSLEILVWFHAEESSEGEDNKHKEFWLDFMARKF